MKTSLMVLCGTLGIVVFVGLSLALWSVSTYNNLVELQLNYETAWSQVENQFQRRYDLVPNLVNTVKGAMKQEQEVFKAIAEARTQYGSSKTVDEKMESGDSLGSAVSRLLVVMENYPELKSNQNVTGLMDELAGTENRVAVERMRYNDVVKEYNVRVKRFPSNILANIFSFEVATTFEAVVGAQIAPQVDFSEI